MNFIDIASLLDRESELKDFAQIVDQREFGEVTSHIAEAMGYLMPFRAVVNVLANDLGGTVFRDDYEYYIAATQESYTAYRFNPFEPHDLNSIPDGNIYCREAPKFSLPVAVYIEHCENLTPSSMANPLVNAIVADYLTYSLNSEQKWSKYHVFPKEHPMQQYFSLDKIIACLPQLSGLLVSVRADIEDSKTTFMNEVIRSHQTYKPGITTLDIYAQSIEGISDAYLEQVYEARGKNYESVAYQDIWDHPDVQDFLETLEVELSRVIGRQTNIERVVAEVGMSHAAIKSHDVYFCHAVGTRVIIKNLGDYRVLSWELSNA